VLNGNHKSVSAPPGADTDTVVGCPRPDKVLISSCVEVTTIFDMPVKALETALRVLSAISEHKPPAPADVEELERLSSQDGPLDEMACDVVAQVLKQRAAMRSHAGV
jgi:hypothetical protein